MNENEDRVRGVSVHESRTHRRTDCLYYSRRSCDGFRVAALTGHDAECDGEQTAEWGAEPPALTASVGYVFDGAGAAGGFRAVRRGAAGEERLDARRAGRACDRGSDRSHRSRTGVVRTAASDGVRRSSRFTHRCRTSASPSPFRGASAALTRVAGLAPASAPRAAAAGAEERQALDLDGLLCLAFLGRGGRGGGIGHGSLLEGSCLLPLHSPEVGRINGARRLIHPYAHSVRTWRAPYEAPRPPKAYGPTHPRRSTGPRPQKVYGPTHHPKGLRAHAPSPRRPTKAYAPSTCGAVCSSSACSPVTRYTTRFATDTAWSANRS